MKLTTKKGFTLIEILMAMGIMSILIVILSQVFLSILTAKLRSEATTTVAQDSRYLLSRLSYDISRASDIVSGSGPSLVLTISGTSYTYSLSGNTLMLTVGSGDPQALSSINASVSNLSFTRTDLGGKKAVQISMDINPANPLPGAPDLSRQLTTTIALK